MVERITLIAALCIIAAVISRLIGKYNKEQALMLSVTVCSVILAFIIINISPAAVFMENIYSGTGIDNEYLVIIFKAVGICYITQFAGNICRDCGESAIASVAEAAGKAALLILAIPLLEDLTVVVDKINP